METRNGTTRTARSVPRPEGRLTRTASVWPGVPTYPGAATAAAAGTRPVICRTENVPSPTLPRPTTTPTFELREDRVGDSSNGVRG